MTRRWTVEHRTTYTYDDDVTDSHGLVVCRPRELPEQAVLAHELWTEPAAADVAVHEDVAGNAAAYFHVTEPHRRLTVGVRSVVVCSGTGALPADPPAWEQCRPEQRRDLPEAAVVAEHVAPSPLVDVGKEVTAYAAESFPPGRPVTEALLDLVARVHADFDYDPGSTDVSTRVPDVLARRRGVCQDFAHLTIAGLRGLGLAARYVSGYLATDPPPGRERVVGADATHAWLALWLPGPDGGGWLAVDPTNDCVVADRHVTVAWGRDYGDVPPVKGVIVTEASTSTMTVTVDVAPTAPTAPTVPIVPTAPDGPATP